MGVAERALCGKVTVGEVGGARRKNEVGIQKTERRTAGEVGGACGETDRAPGRD